MGFSDAFKDSRLSRYGRTTGTTTDIHVDLGSQYFLSYIALLGTNLSQYATIIVYGNTSNDFTGYLVSYALTPAVNIIDVISDEDYNSGYFNLVGADFQYIGGNASPTNFDYFLTDEFGNQIVDEFGNSVYGFIWVIDTTVYDVTDEFVNQIWGNIYSSGYRYWKISISDPLNSSGYIEISKLYFGDYLQLPGMSRDQKIPKASTSKVTESTTGQSYGDKGITYNYGSITFPFVDDDEKLQIDTAFDVIDKVEPFIMMIWEEELDVQPAIYSLLTTDLDWQRIPETTPRVWSLNFGFKETF